MAMHRGAGPMRDRLTIQTPTEVAVYLASLTRSGAVATATTTAAHGFTSNDYVTLAGATPSAYNGKVKITVTGPTTFTYAISGAPATPATGSISATYVSDAQGGRRSTWSDLATVWAEMIPIRSGERLQLAAIQSDTAYRFRIRVRADLTTKMRALWTPQQPPGSTETTLEISGVLPDSEDVRTYQILEMAVAP